MFKSQSLKVGDIIAIDLALEEVTNQAMRNGRLAYKLGRFKGYTEKVRQEAEEARQQLYSTLGESPRPDGSIVIPKENLEEFKKQLKALMDSEDEVRVPISLKMTELEECGVYFKPTFYKALGDLVEVDDPEEDKAKEA